MSSARRLATPIAIAILAAGALAYATLIDRHEVSDSDRVERAADVFPSFRVDEVRHIEIFHDQEKLSLDRSPTDSTVWLMTSPRKEKANQGAVSALLRDLELADRLRIVPEGEAAGLDAPRARGNVTVGALHYTFVLGADALRPEGAAYMRIGKDPPFVVDRALKVQLLQEIDAYRVRDLVPYGESAIARVEVRRPSGGFELDRSADEFRVGSAAGPRAARAIVERVFEALANLRADTFVDDAEADRTLGAAKTTLHIVPTDSGSQDLDVAVGAACTGQPGDLAVARIGDAHVAACIATRSLDALDQTPDTLVDRSVFYAHDDEMEEVRLERTKGERLRIQLVRKGTGWHEQAPDNRDLDPDEVDSANVLARALAQAQAVDVEPNHDRHRSDSVTRATVVRTGSHAEESIDIDAPSSDGSALAIRNDDGAVLRLARAVARRLEPHPVTLRPRRLWTTPFDAATLVDIEDACGPTFEKLSWIDDRWKMAAPAGLPVDTSAAADLAANLAHATADAWLTEHDDGSFGLEHGCVVKLELQSGGSGRSVPDALTFGAMGDGGIYARASDAPAVFVAPMALFALVRHPTVDRSRLRIDSTLVSKVAMSHDGHAVTLVASEEGLTRAGNADSDAGPADRLGIAVAGFYSTNALHGGPPFRAEGFDAPTLVIDTVGALLSTPGKSAPGGAHILVGARGRDGDDDVYFARVQGLDATFSVPGKTVDSILEAW